MLEGKKFDVEHALNLIADGYFYLPASHLYDDEALKPHLDMARRCHIYMIGYVPVVDLEEMRQEGRDVIAKFAILGKIIEITIPLRAGHNLDSKDGYWYIIDGNGQRFLPTAEQMLQQVSRQVGGLEFEVLYIGQAYGKNGSRNALDRLRKHETLQKIALQDSPDGYRLELLLIEIQPNKIITVFNPEADDKTQGNSRISSGLDKLFGTNEHERITLYEASLIRYFQPKYNKEFKNSFPSTTMKVLQDCYDKDFSSVIAEFALHGFVYNLWTEEVLPKADHWVSHDLHDDEARRVFFADK